MITITTIFATLAISKSAKLLDYSSVLSTFGTLFLCLITNSLKDPGYHGCLCQMRMYVCNASCNGSPVLPSGVYFVNQIIRGITRRPYFMPTLSYIILYTKYTTHHGQVRVVYKGFGFIVESLWFAGAVLFHS